VAGKSNKSLYSYRFLRWIFVGSLPAQKSHLNRFDCELVQIISGAALIPSNSARAMISGLLAFKSLQTRFSRTSRVLPAGRGSARNSSLSISD
jgi:hypothetical protein